MRGLLPSVCNNLSRHTVVFLFWKKKDFWINYDPVSKVAQSRQTLVKPPLGSGFFLLWLSRFLHPTRLMLRWWVYILRRIYLPFRWNQVWIEMLRLQRKPWRAVIWPDLLYQTPVCSPATQHLISAFTSSFLLHLQHGLFCFSVSSVQPGLPHSTYNEACHMGNAIKQESLHWLDGAAGPSILCHHGNCGF